MKGKWTTNFIVLGLLIAALGALVACGTPAAPPATATPPPVPTQPAATAKPAATVPAADGQSLLESRCTVCHSLDRVKSAKKTRDQWTQTVRTMVSRGAQLNTSEQSTLIDYLTKTYGQ